MRHEMAELPEWHELKGLLDLGADLLHAEIDEGGDHGRDALPIAKHAQRDVSYTDGSEIKANK